jgi:YYY domain-containing protein
MMRSLLDRHSEILLLALLLAVALSLRLFGQNWDQGTYQHPDERFIAMVSADSLSMPAVRDLGEIFRPATSPINPRRDDANGNPMSFAYGSLPLYVQGTVSAGLNVFSDRDWGSYRELYRVGRTLTAVIDTITVALVFLTGRRLFGSTAGFVAAGLYAFSVLAIQLSHFFAVDSWLTLFVTAALFATIRYIDSPTMLRAATIGGVLGLAFATKASVPSLLVPVVFGFGYVFWGSQRRPDVVLGAAVGTAVSLAVFTLFEPYALVRSGAFFEDIRTQARILRGQSDIPFTRQFVGLTPGIYELRNLFAYSIGPGFLVGALAAFAFSVRRAMMIRDPRLAVLLLWIVAYVPTLLITEARFLRYSLPLLPTLAVLTGGFLVWLIAQPRYRLPGQIATILVLGFTVVWAAGFMTIYMQEHTRIAASKWIHANVPAGTMLSAESWDDPLPTRYPGSPPIQYRIQTLDIYGDRPPEEKVDYLFDALEDVEYIVLSSNRLVYSVENLPWRYAVQNEYYRRLDNGQLGYQLVYEGLVQPTLFGFEYDDRGADESFTVYDHPHVRIYKRVERLSREEFHQRFLWSINQPWEPQRYPEETWLMLDQPVSEIPITNDSSWNAPAVRSGIVAAVSWVIVIEVIGLSVLPLSARLLNGGADRGAFSSRLIGIVLIGWLVWIGASIGFWGATAWTAAALLIVIAAACWLPRLSSMPIRFRPALPSIRQYLTGTGVFTGIFVLFLLFRAIYPDFWQTYFGGEKPFELAYLRAVSASVEFPPYDPWYADGIINYYYYGWHLASSVIKLSGVGVSHGFQLAIATTGALVALQCLAFAGLLTRRGAGWLWAAIPATGVFSIFLLSFAGNLDGLIQTIEHRAASPDLFDFWRSTRVIDFTINEFPYFSQIWADLHPHVMNLPHYVLLLTLLSHVVISARVPQSECPTGESTTHPLAAMAVALVLGTMTVTNAWDAPLAIGLAFGAFMYAGLLRGGLHILTGLGYGIIAAATSFFLFLPFHTSFYSVVEGVETTSEMSPLGQFLTHWGLLYVVVFAVILASLLRRRDWRNHLLPGMLMASLVLVGGGIGAAVQGLRDTELHLGALILSLLVATVVVSTAAMTASIARIRYPAIALNVLLASLAGILAAGRPAASVSVAFAAAATVVALRYWRSPPRFVPWALIGIACITIASVEVLHIADDLRNSPWERMNTVFKFYLQAWVLLALGSALVLTRAVHRPTGAESNSRTVAYLPIVTMAVVVVIASIYPILGTPARLNQDMDSTPAALTLDGYAWMDGGTILNGTGDVITFAGDLDAIEWFNEHVTGAPVLLEASIGPYRGNGSRISSATGLPTILGWDRHQRQQRYEPGISQRMRDVRTMYNEEDLESKLEMLRRYNVRYVVVGDVERYWNTPDQPDYYASRAGLAAFDALVNSGLSVAFASGATTIYQVDDLPRVPAAVQR